MVGTTEGRARDMAAMPRQAMEEAKACMHDERSPRPASQDCANRGRAWAIN